MADSSEIRGSELTPNGGVIEIPREIHVTADMVREQQITDATLRDLPRLGRDYGTGNPETGRLLAAERGISERMGLEKPPEIIVASISSGMTEMPFIGSGFTKEGTPYIQVNPAALRTMSPEQMEALLALETDRLKNRDASPEHAAAAFNDQSIAFRDTFRADHDATGPLGTCNPRALAEALGIMESLRVKTLIEAGATDVRDPEHPPLDQRVARLQEQQGCPSR